MKLEHNAVKNKNQLKNMTACFLQGKKQARFPHHFGIL
jgi:hypothetical protein